MPRVRVSAKLYAARWLEWCDTMAPLGSAVVPEVNRICQMSSPWISAAGSVTACPATKSANATLPGTTSPPIGMVTPGVRPASRNAFSAAGQASASTTANDGSTKPIRWLSTSPASDGLTGTQTSPALAMPILVR